MSVNNFFAEEGLKFHYISGGVTPVEAANTTGWRFIGGLLVIQAANAVCKVSVEEREDYLTQEGGGILVCPDVYHKIDIVNAENAISRWSVVNYNVLGTLNISALLKVPVIVDKSTAFEIGEINEELHRLHQQLQTFSIANFARIKELGYRLLYIISNVSSKKENADVFLRKIVQLMPVLKYIDANMKNPVNCDYLANLASMSVSRFHMVFKQTLFVSPMQYIKKLRMNKAQMLVIGSELSISEIAEAVGYKDQFHFSHDFKRYYHKAPLQFRKEFAKGFTL